MFSSMSLIRWSQRVLGLLGRSKHTEDSSEANPPAQARDETTLTVLPHLPNEIILAIVGRLEFGDLKSIRLLSKAWCFCASPSLFAKTKALQFHNDNMIAFSGLETLKLGFATYGHLDTPKPGENIAGLPALLASMNHLKFLALQLPAFKDGFHNYYTYKQVFPEKMRWENLKTLGLFQLRIGATDLILLFLDAMPGLKSLKMGELSLSHGCWEGVFEALKQMHRLEVLRLPDLTRFYHHGKQELVGDLETKLTVYRQLPAYVKNGKRHPFLLLGQPNSAAREYTKDLEPELRQRLLDLDSPYWPADSEEDCDSMLAQDSDGGEVMDY